MVGIGDENATHEAIDRILENFNLEIGLYDAGESSYIFTIITKTYGKCSTVARLAHGHYWYRTSEECSILH